jgi:hypothetical protein
MSVRSLLIETETKQEISMSPNETKLTFDPSKIWFVNTYAHFHARFPDDEELRGYALILQADDQVGAIAVAHDECARRFLEETSLVATWTTVDTLSHGSSVMDNWLNSIEDDVIDHERTLEAA